MTAFQRGRIVIVTLLVLALFGVAIAEHQADLRQRCEARGGVLLNEHGYYPCVAAPPVKTP